MNLTKSVPDGLKPQECKRTKLSEPPPVPYVPYKDEVQEEVAKLRNLEIKTTLKKDTTINFPVWCKNGTQEAFLMHLINMVLSGTTTRPRRLIWKPRRRFSWWRLV